MHYKLRQDLYYIKDGKFIKLPKGLIIRYNPITAHYIAKGFPEVARLLNDKIIKSNPDWFEACK